MAGAYSLPPQVLAALISDAFGVIFTFIIGILPPALGIKHTWGYVFAVLFGTFILAVPPLTFLKMKKPEWRRNDNK